MLAGALDTLKGAIAVEVASAASLPLAGILLGGAAALLGHKFPHFCGDAAARDSPPGLGCC